MYSFWGRNAPIDVGKLDGFEANWTYTWGRFFFFEKKSHEGVTSQSFRVEMEKLEVSPREFKTVAFFFSTRLRSLKKCDTNVLCIVPIFTNFRVYLIKV